MSIRDIVTAFNFLAIALPYGAQCAGADLANFPKGEIVRAGICEPTKVRAQYSLPESSAGYAINASLRITRETDVIPLQKGISFGITWRAANLPERAEIAWRVDHPPITRPDGVTLDRDEEALIAPTKAGRIETTDCFMLGQDHELVPGKWTLSILHKGQLLVQRTFHVQPPR